jgi:hypothetical protein
MLLLRIMKIYRRHCPMLVRRALTAFRFKLVRLILKMRLGSIPVDACLLGPLSKVSRFGDLACMRFLLVEDDKWMLGCTIFS